MIRAGGVLAAALLVAACGSPTPRLAPGDAMAGAPLEHAAIVAATAEHLWITDHDRLATYDVDDGHWHLADLPGSAKEVDLVAGAPIDGGLALLVSMCDGPCMEMRENLVGIDAFVAPAPGELLEVPMEGGPSAFGGIDVVHAGGATARFRTNGDGHELAFDVGPDGATVRPIDADPIVGCETDGGVVALEQVALGAPGSTAPVPAAPGNLAEGIGARRVGAGADWDHLRPLTVPEPVSAVLADVIGTGATCLPDGIALLQHDQAWELHGDAWSQAPADLGATMYYELRSQVVELPDGTLVAGYAQREPAGSWHDHDVQEQVAVMGDVVIRHRAYP